ncbi:hypothetical protein D7294_09440 [Streptomyces hoynatensis]|uniref:ABM domain-containing protein n=1 Tax=Streptomyces hoynatensis TaxID=1141874 RepID=A0A3A9Z6L0_9ACTN|nr:hypothetical protein D7294_09440 [Streptomyces hoynatensis]
MLRHARLVGDQEDVDSVLTLRLVRRPGAYVHVTFWRTLGGFIEAVHRRSYLRRARRLGGLVETAADQAVSVRSARGERAGEIAAAARVRVTRYRVAGNGRAFERNLWDRGDLLARQGAGCGSQVLRSALCPQCYVGLEWSQHREEFEGVLRNEHYRRLSSLIAEAAEAEVEDSLHLAGRPGAPVPADASPALRGTGPRRPEGAGGAPGPGGG